MGGIIFGLPFLALGIILVSMNHHPQYALGVVFIVIGAVATIAALFDDDSG